MARAHALDLAESLRRKQGIERVGLDPFLVEQLASMGSSVCNLAAKREGHASTPAAHAAAAAAPVVVGPALEGCGKCVVYQMQVQALAQALTGLGARAFNWSEGLGKVRRRDLAELVLEYVRPLAHLDTDVGALCEQLSGIQWAAPGQPAFVSGSTEEREELERQALERRQLEYSLRQERERQALERRQLESTQRQEALRAPALKPALAGPVGAAPRQAAARGAEEAAAAAEAAGVALVGAAGGPPAAAASLARDEPEAAAGGAEEAAAAAGAEVVAQPGLGPLRGRAAAGGSPAAAPHFAGGGTAPHTDGDYSFGQDAGRLSPAGIPGNASPWTSDEDEEESEEESSEEGEGEFSFANDQTAVTGGR